jgi:quercetin dioxygenase-like cupin family protein
VLGPTTSSTTQSSACPDAEYNLVVKVIRSDQMPTVERDDLPLFTGKTSMRTAVDEGQFRVAYVTFSDGVRNKLHVHGCDQVLIVTQGKGLVVTEGAQVEVDEGDVVFAPAGEKHWHGAAPGSTMTHITITEAGAKTEQLEP